MITTLTSARSFRLPTFSFLLVFLLSAAWLPAQIQDRPQVGPEQKLLGVWVGKWKYEGSLHNTPFGTGGKFAGKQTAKMVLDGLFLEGRGEDKGTYGGKEMIYKAMQLRWYDSTAKVYRERNFDNDGFVSEGVTTVSGNIWTTKSTISDGKAKGSHARNTATFSPDGKTVVTKGEISTDGGKTWIPWWDQTTTKVGK